MTATKKGLGRGLSALIPDADMDFLSEFTRSTLSPRASASKAPVKPATGSESAKAPAVTPSTSGHSPVKETSAEDSTDIVADLNAAGSSTVGGSHMLGVAQIKPNPYQPRRYFSDEEMGELVSSIKTHGLLQPVLVRPTSAATADEPALYQLVAGERRWRAAQLAGLDSIPAVVRQVDDQQALELALIENVQRHDISAIDAAIAYQRLASEFGLSQEQIALRVGKSRSAVANTVRLLDLPQEVRKAIEDGALSEGHGRAILLAPGDGARRAIFRRVLRDKLSVRETERLAQHSVDAVAPDQQSNGDSGTDNESVTTANNDNDQVSHLEEELKKILGTRLHLKVRRKGGELVINFSSKDELERIVKLIMGGPST
ncbi:MAG TPA: ParB/RepB/Spo0J family partition protein [Abditibacteriaceae bacterium]|jgi:ParB family chromosome partitioning protein